MGDGDNVHLGDDMNCRTCVHNHYEPVMESGDPAEGMINNCYGIEGQEDITAPVSPIQLWIDQQKWDAECLCPEVTEPCPGFKAKP